MAYCPTTDIRVLLELRPALAGHAGIPQATRLLFRHLAALSNVRVTGLIQSHNRVLGRGLPQNGRGLFGKLRTDQRLNRSSRVVIGIEQGVSDWHLNVTAHTVMMVVFHLLGGKQALTSFESQHFRDFVWRRFFARTLPPEDLDIVLRAAYRIARVPWNAMNICGLVTRRFGRSLYPRLDTEDFDIMIAETPYPASVGKNTKLVIRYHDAIPLLMPHTISDRRFHQAFHYRALRYNVRNGAWFVCVSDATRKDLVAVFPEAEARSVTIHNVVSHDYYQEDSRAECIPEIISARSSRRLTPRMDSTRKRQFVDALSSNGDFGYLLMVSTVEPRKNHLNLLTAWERLRVTGFPELRMIVVGALGWHHKAILNKLLPWFDRGEVFMLQDVLASELRLLYRHAKATVCPSFGEGFDFAGVESMSSGGAVVASDIPVHREIYCDAAEYFNPYCVEGVATAIRNVISPESTSRRNELVIKGAVNAQRFTESAILPKWRDFLSIRPMRDQ